MFRSSSRLASTLLGTVELAYCRYSRQQHETVPWRAGIPSSRTVEVSLLLWRSKAACPAPPPLGCSSTSVTDVSQCSTEPAAPQALPMSHFAAQLATSSPDEQRTLWHRECLFVSPPQGQGCFPWGPDRLCRDGQGLTVSPAPLGACSYQINRSPDRPCFKTM